MEPAADNGERSPSQARRARLRVRLADAGLDALLVTRLVNVRYLTGFTGSAAALLVTADDDGDLLVTDARYAERACAEAPGLRRHITRGSDWLEQRLEAGTTLGLESHDVSWDRARRLADLLGEVTVVPAPGHVEALRAVKDPDEIAVLRRACAVADAAFSGLPEWLAPGLTERDVAVRLERDMVDLGAADRSFETIVASGPNSAVPHHRPTRRVLERGDVVELDYGALVDGYHSDMTRVLCLGEPIRALREVFAVVRSAQEAGLAACVDGAEAQAVDAACRDVIAEAGHGDRFVHGTGHGLGLEIHEDPYLGPGAAATLRSRMVVTVEPGVYLPGVGGVRIEDALAVTTGDPDVLTCTPKDLVVL
ncbi:MAG: Xaa-Pro peptidase family protein [Actinomycetota bacterium]|nr:Xaa-Pro peptidase family protein [Actinomycetota bacterium]